MKKTLLSVVLLLSAAAIFAGGSGESAAPATEPVKVFASILPQQYFLERIGGERIETSIMVLPGKSPATYSPTPQQVTALGEADVFFTIGVPFEEAFIPTIEKSLPNLLIADTSQGIEKRSLGGHDHDDNAPGHGEGMPDPHIWMSPILVKHQAEIMAKTLSEIDPEGRDYYAENLKSFSKDLDDLNTSLAESFAPYKGETFFVYHPAFGYLADLYDLTQEAIETGGKEPKPAQLEQIIEHAREEGVHVIFVQPEFPADSAQAVADAIDGTVVPVAPLNPDYINNLKSIAEAIKTAME